DSSVTGVQTCALPIWRRVGRPRRMTVCSRASMRKLRLYWIPGSAAMAPHAALAEIGVDYELARVERDESGASPPEYLALNPSGRSEERRVGKERRSGR